MLLTNVYLCLASKQMIEVVYCTDHSVLGHALLGLELSGESSSGDMNSEDMKRLQCNDEQNTLVVMMMLCARSLGSSWITTSSIGCSQLTYTQFPSPIKQC